MGTVTRHGHTLKGSIQETFLGTDTGLKIKDFLSSHAFSSRLFMIQVNKMAEGKLMNENTIACWSD